MRWALVEAAQKITTGSGPLREKLDRIANGAGARSPNSLVNQRHGTVVEIVRALSAAAASAGLRLGIELWLERA